MGADMFEATEPEARVAPDPDESDHALLLQMKRVGVDAGQVLWNTSCATREEFHGSRPALISACYGRPGRQVWLFPFKVPRVGRLSTRRTPVSDHPILHGMLADLRPRSTY